MSTAAEKAQTAFAAISARRFRKEVTREEYNEEVSRISSEFAHDLWAEHLPILPLEAADHVYDRAWSEGHSSGYFEVENHYMDLADMVEKLLQAIKEAEKNG